MLLNALLRETQTLTNIQVDAIGAFIQAYYGDDAADYFYGNLDQWEEYGVVRNYACKVFVA